MLGRRLSLSLVVALAARCALGASGATPPVHAGHALAYDAADETYYVAYMGVETDQDPFVTTFDAYGTATGAGEYRVTSDAALQRRVAITRDESNERFLVVYDQDGGQVQLRLMNEDGTFVGAAINVSNATIGTSRERPAIAQSDDGTTMVIAWEDDRASFRVDVWANVFTIGGTPVGPGENRVSAADAGAESPAATFLSALDLFLVVYVEPTTKDIGASFVTKYGTGLGAPYTLYTGTTSPTHPAVACDPATGEGLLVWEESGDIMGLRLDDLAVGVDSPFIIATGTLSSPDVCWEPTNGYWLVAWQADNGSDMDIEGCVVPAMGTTIGTTYVLAGTTDQEHSPSIVAARAGRGHAAVSYWNDAADAPAVALLGEAKIYVGNTVYYLNELSITAHDDVWLQTPPATNVTINVACGSPADMTVTPASLTFTPTNCFTPQQVALDPISDAIDEEHGESFDVTLSVDAGSDAAYAALPDITIGIVLREWTEPTVTCGAAGAASAALLFVAALLLRRRR
jgi:hypothetical protein